MFDLYNLNRKIQLIHNVFEPWFCTLDTSVSASITFTRANVPGFITSTNQIFVNIGHFLDKYTNLTEAQLNWKLVFVVIHELSHINQIIDAKQYTENYDYFSKIEGGNNYNVYRTIFNNRHLLSLLPFPVEYVERLKSRKNPSSFTPDELMYKRYMFLAREYRDFYKLKSIEDIVRFKMRQLRIPSGIVEEALSNPILYLKFPDVLIPIKVNTVFVCDKNIMRSLTNKIIECRLNKFFPVEIYRG